MAEFWAAERSSRARQKMTLLAKANWPDEFRPALDIRQCKGCRGQQGPDSCALTRVTRGPQALYRVSAASQALLRGCSPAMCAQPVGTLLPDRCEEIHVPHVPPPQPSPGDAVLEEALVAGSARALSAAEAAVRRADAIRHDVSQADAVRREAALSGAEAEAELARMQAAAAAAEAAVVAAVREMEIQSRDPHDDDRNHWHAAGHNRQRLPRISQPLVQPHAAPRPAHYRGTGSAGAGDRLHVSSNVVPGRAPSVKNNIIPGKPTRKLTTTACPVATAADQLPARPEDQRLARAEHQLLARPEEQRLARAENQILARAENQLLARAEVQQMVPH